jgi:hypothetical protein
LALSGPADGLNGGSAFKHSETFSFQIATDDQEETAIGPPSSANGGQRGGGRVSAALRMEIAASGRYPLYSPLHRTKAMDLH